MRGKEGMYMRDELYNTKFKQNHNLSALIQRHVKQKNTHTIMSIANVSEVYAVPVICSKRGNNLSDL